MEEKTVKQLREELVELGMPKEDAEKMSTKAQIQAIIDTFKANKVTSLNEKPNPQEEKDTEKAWQSKADRMHDFFEKQEKVRVLIPLDPNEKPGVVNTITVRGRKQYVYVSGAVWSKSFNGYRVIIPKGTYTEVPEAVAENIADEFRQTQAAGEQWKIDRIDTRTGKPVKDQL
jgi:hypothetical protein